MVECAVEMGAALQSPDSVGKGQQAPAGKSNSTINLRTQSNPASPSPQTPVAVPAGVVATFTNHETNLAALLAFDQKSTPSTHIPLLVTKCLNRLFDLGLSTEGIFRVPGNSNRMIKVENEFNSGNGATCDFKKMSVSVEDAASLLKKFLRESLSDTLFPAAMIPEFEALRNTEGAPRNVAFLALWNRLPNLNRAVLSALFDLLLNVAANSFLNLMNIDNLGTVFGGMANIPMPDGKWILVYILEEYETLFAAPALQQATTPVFRRKLINHTRSIFTLGHIEDKNVVISADGNGTLNIWDARTFALIKKMSSDMKCYVPQVFINLEGVGLRQLWTFYPDAIRIWDIADILNPNIKKIEENPANLIPVANACAVAVVGESIWVAGDRVVVLDVLSHQVIKEITEYTTVGNASEQPIHVIAYCAGFVWIWKNKTLHVWDTDSFSKIREITIDGFSATKSCQFYHSQPTNEVWISTDNGSLVILDLGSFSIKSVVTGGHSSTVYHIIKIGDLVWSSSWDTTICWWKTNPVELVYKMPNRHTDAISYVLPVWREELNGWDVWSSSWDRSCQVTFIPSSYAHHVPALADGIASSTSDHVSSANSAPVIGNAGGNALAPPSSSPGPASHSASSNPPSPIISHSAASSPGPSIGASGGGASASPAAASSPNLTRPVPPPGFNPPPPQHAPPPHHAGPGHHGGHHHKTSHGAHHHGPPQIPLPFPSTLSRDPSGGNVSSGNIPPAEGDASLSLPQMENLVISLEKHLSAQSSQHDRELDQKLNDPTSANVASLKQFIKSCNDSEIELQLRIENLRLRIRAEHLALRYAKVYTKLNLK